MPIKDRVLDKIGKNQNSEMNRNVECDKPEAIPLDMKVGLGSK